MKTTLKRIPDRCPVHLTSGKVRTHTTESDPYTVSLEHKLTQHQCAEPDCGEYLGWEYHGPKEAFEAGPGRCSDVQILLKVKGNKHDMESQNAIGVGGIIMTAALLASWWPALSITHNAAWTTWHSVACIASAALVIGAIALLNREATKNRPTEESLRNELQN